jgi:hypothetical protein
MSDGDYSVRQRALEEAEKRHADALKRQMRERTTARRERCLRRSGRWIAILELTDWLARQGGLAGPDADLGARVYREFWISLRDGEFDRSGSTRVLLLNPISPWARLTPERGRCALETHKWEVFVKEFLSCSWIEIEPMRHWLLGWLPRDLCQRWEIDHATARMALDDRAVPGSATSVNELTKPEPISGRDPGPHHALSAALLTPGTRTNKAEAAEEACRRWITGLKERPAKKDAAFEAAKDAVASIGPLSRKAFDRAWGTAAPGAWKKAGRPPS